MIFRPLTAQGFPLAFLPRRRRVKETKALHLFFGLESRRSASMRFRWTVWILCSLSSCDVLTGFWSRPASQDDGKEGCLFYFVLFPVETTNKILRKRTDGVTVQGVSLFYFIPLHRFFSTFAHGKPSPEWILFKSPLWLTNTFFFLLKYFRA